MVPILVLMHVEKLILPNYLDLIDLFHLYNRIFRDSPEFFRIFNL